MESRIIEHSRIAELLEGILISRLEWYRKQRYEAMASRIKVDRPARDPRAPWPNGPIHIPLKARPLIQV
jgi:hypothetical protein